MQRLVRRPLGLLMLVMVALVWWCSSQGGAMTGHDEVNDGYDPANLIRQAINNSRQLSSVQVSIRTVIDEGTTRVVRDERIVMHGNNSYSVRFAPSPKQRLLIDGREFVRRSDAEPWRAFQAEYLADRVETAPWGIADADAPFFGLHPRLLADITVLPFDREGDEELLHFIADYSPGPLPYGTAELVNSKAELWITPEPSLIKRFSIRQVFALEGQAMRRSQTTVAFSGFDEPVELPSPDP